MAQQVHTDDWRFLIIVIFTFLLTGCAQDELSRNEIIEQERLFNESIAAFTTAHWSMTRNTGSFTNPGSWDFAVHSDSVLAVGLDRATKVTDRFLMRLHPELLDMYRNKLVRGWRWARDQRLGKMPNPFDSSSDRDYKGWLLINEWDEWWQIHGPTLINSMKP